MCIRFLAFIPSEQLEYEKIGWEINKDSASDTYWHYKLDASSIQQGIQLSLMIDHQKELFYIGCYLYPKKTQIINWMKIDGIQDFVELSRKIIVFGIPLYNSFNII